MKTMLFAVAASMAIAGAASAVTWNITLSGLQENPPNASPAIGDAKVKFNPNTNFIKITGSFSGMIGNVTAGHLHGLAPADMNAPVLFSVNPTLGGTSGTFGATAFLTDAQEIGFFDYMTYLNIHTNVFPGGELRGQVVPAPAGAALLGAAGLFGLRRRR